MATEIRRPRVASPARWQQALNRAVAGNVRVYQVESTGQWIATSASNPGTAYVVDVTGKVAHACSCAAGMNNDEVCCHRAAWYLAAGILDPVPPTPAPALVYSGAFAGKQRTVTIVERRDRPGTYDLIDYGHRQKLGGAGDLDFVLSRLRESGFVPAPVPATTTTTTATVAA